MPKYKAVIFDFDDTLVESRLKKWAHHKHVAKKFYNIDLTDEIIKEHWGKPLNTLVSKIYQDSDTLENMLNALISTREDFRKEVYEGAVDLVKGLLEQGIKIGVLSATNKKYLVVDLEEAGFPVDKMIIQGADETDVHKPDPAVFLPILEELAKENIKPKEMVYVGDSINDMLASTRAGLDFIALTTGLYAEGDFKAQGTKKIATNIKEVLQWLDA